MSTQTKERVKGKRDAGKAARLSFDGGSWSRIEVGDDFLVGATEGGFMGLEEFNPATAPPKSSKQRKSAADAGHKTVGGQIPPAPAPDKQTVSKASRKRQKLERPVRPAKTNQQPPLASTEPTEFAASQQQPTALETAGQHTDITAWHGLGLDARLLHCLAALGFSTPTPVQQDCLPPAIRDKRDVIGAAQTGSGKTLAFGLPILQHLAAQAEEASPSSVEQAMPQSPLRALIFAPTRELALQVCEHLQPFGKASGIRVVPVVGGLAPAKQLRLLSKQPAVVVATPGRLWELMRSGEPHLSDLSGLSFLVLDEADRMVQAGHFQELNNILGQIPGLQQAATQTQPKGKGKHKAAAKPAKKLTEDLMQDDSASKNSVQTFVFSATLTLPQSLRRRLKKGGGGASGSSTLESLMDKIAFRGMPKVVDLTSERKLADQVEEAQIQCTDEHRDELLYYLVARHPGRTLVFANAISTVRRLAAVMSHLKVPCGALHAGMQQRQRLTALDRFKSSPDAVMIATDVAARGIDVQGISCVVHYQLPASGDMYVHRCGRTARAGNAGVAVALVTPQEAPRFSALLQALGRGIPPDMPIDSGMLPGARNRVRLAVRLDKLVRSGRKARAEEKWRVSATKELDMDASDGEQQPDRRQRTASSAEAASLQQELGRLLAEPLQPRFSSRYFTGHPAAAVVQSHAAVHGVSSRPAQTKSAGADSPTDQEQQEASKHAGAVSDAIALAKELAASRKAVSQGASRKGKRCQPGKQHKQGKQAPMKKRRGGMVVIPAAVGRAASGPDALQLLRAQRGLL